MSKEVYKQLEQYAMDHYEAGGHWVVETFDDEDYEEVLAKCMGDVERAKAALKKEWELLCEREQECSWGDGEF